MSEFMRLIISLDQLLTGRPYKDCYNNFAKKRDPWSDPAFWLWERKDIYYLSDGGYSRIAASLENYCVFLCMGALESVAVRWNDPDVRLIRGRIDQLLRAEVEAEEAKARKGEN